MLKRLRILLVACFFVTQALIGQNANSIVIHLDVDAGQIKAEDKSKIPFDQPFFIEGTTKNTGIKAVMIKYKVHGGFEDRHYFADGHTPDAEGYIDLGQYPIRNGTFTFIAPKLHPNEFYDFVFDFQEALGLSETVNNQLRLNILNTVNAAYTITVGQTAPSQALLTMNATIAKDIKAATNNKPLYNADNQAVGDLTDYITEDPLLSNSLGNLANYNAEIYKLNKALLFLAEPDEEREEVVYNTLKAYDQLLVAMDSTVTKVLANDAYKTRLEAPVNILVDANTTLKTVLEFVQNDGNRATFNLDKAQLHRLNIKNIADLPGTNSYVFEILIGRAKMKGNIVESASAYDVQSVELLLASLVHLQNFKDADGNLLLPQGSLTPLNNLLINWLSKVGQIDDWQSKITDEINTHTTLLENTYSRFSVLTRADTYTDIQSEESPYIGIDFGVMVAPEISSTFVFEGVNFHLKPVNRHAKFSDLKGWDEQLKRISFSFGVAQRVGDYNDTYENLVGVGSPFVGVGYRLNRMIRINAGGLFYKSQDPNPIINETSVKGTYFLSASIDIKLKDAIQIIGNFL